jgi:hypothetical protein
MIEYFLEGPSEVDVMYSLAVAYAIILLVRLILYLTRYNPRN